MDYDIDFLSSGCSRATQSVSWGRNGLVAYASGKNVCLLDPGENQRLGRLLSKGLGHTQTISCVQCHFVVSTDIGGHIIVWSVRSNDRRRSTLTELFMIGKAIKAHNTAINSLCVASTESHFFTFTTGSDGILKFGQLTATQTCSKSGDSIDWQLIGKHELVKVRPLCCDMIKIDIFLTAVGSDDSKIRLFICDQNTKAVHLAHTLLGHKDWVRALAFLQKPICPETNTSELLLASGSQDKHIRLWSLNKLDKKATKVNGDTQHTDTQLTPIKLKTEYFEYTNSESNMSVSYSVHLSAVLSAHNGWVLSLCWHPHTTDPRLLSASMDKTLIIWYMDTQSALWLDSTRLGEVGGQPAGYYSCAFQPISGDAVLGVYYTGAINMWTTNNQHTAQSEWAAWPVPGGHCAAVSDCAWDRTGSVLLSCSTDQTTRLWAPVTDLAAGPPDLVFEINRPQVHGYDLQCLASVNQTTFVSGAEEKILRLFSAPRALADAVNSLCAPDIVDSLSIDGSCLDAGASLPSLGLSNKPMQADTVDTEKNYHFSTVNFDVPPTEDNLLENTLWPEKQKLYGHGFELYSVACSHNGNVLISSCKSSQAEQATICVWCVQSGQLKTQLASHQLTVTALRFAPNDRYILAVSRDRNWTVFAALDQEFSWQLAAKSEKSTSHARIIWDCCWAPDSLTFYTVSRDKKIMVWRLTDSDGKISVELLHSETLDESITCCDCTAIPDSENNLVAAGLDDGRIILLRWSAQTNTFDKTQLTIRAHSSTVRRCHFRPITGQWRQTSNQSALSVASCSDDHSLAVHNVYMDMIGTD